MQGSTEVIEALNEVLVRELTAINQYFLHAKMCKNWGYEKIAAKVYEESIDEMKHASKLADRLLLLEGVPNFQKLNKIRIGESIQEQLECDMAMEKAGIETLRKSIDVCFEHKDHVSRELLETILNDEENHLDWLEAQLQLIRDVGIENYLTQQI